MSNTNPKFIKVKLGVKIDVISIRIIIDQEIDLLVETEVYLLEVWEILAEIIDQITGRSWDNFRNAYGQDNYRRDYRQDIYRNNSRQDYREDRYKDSRTRIRSSSRDEHRNNYRSNSRKDFE